MSDNDGHFWFKAVVPVSYPIPSDGPVGRLLALLGRHFYRPAHMHFMFAKDGYDPLITALYLRNDPYENSDAVFGVKSSLVIDLGTVNNEALAKKHGVELGTSLIEYDFILVTKAEALSLRESKAAEAMQAQGRNVNIIDGLPVPSLD
ncbi:hypothetical protein ACHAQJ_008923 [Trichoderma viride]